MLKVTLSDRAGFKVIAVLQVLWEQMLCMDFIKRLEERKASRSNLTKLGHFGERTVLNKCCWQN